MLGYFREFRKFAAVFGRKGHLKVTPNRLPTIVCNTNKIRLNL